MASRHFPARSRALVAAVILATPLAMPYQPAHAEVRRCTMPDGRTLYTDRRCDAFGAVERRTPDPPAGRSGGTSTRLYRGGCARNLQDLVYELTTSIDSHDVNRLAAVYHWPGMSSTNANGVMRRLDAIVQRPLVDVVPVQPRVETAGGEFIDGNYHPQASVRRPPTGIRLEQTLANGSTPSRTHFGLRRHMDCWWIQL